MSRNLDVEYLKRVLSLDPRVSAERIIASRAEVLGLSESVVSLRHVRTGATAANARAMINTVRRDFWTLPIDDLRSRLNAIDLAPYPELAVVVDRLKQAAEMRADFPRLAQALGGNSRLLDNLKRSITLPPRDLAGMKEAIMRALFRGEHTNEYKAAAKIIRIQFPNIYAFEQQWVDDILSARRPGVGRFPSFSIRLPIPFWAWWIIGMALIRGCVSLMR